MHAKSVVDLHPFSKSDLQALNHMVAEHGKKSFDELKALTHEMAAYRKAWEEREEGTSAVPMSYEDFFDEDPDAIDGALEEMIENYRLRKALS